MGDKIRIQNFFDLIVGTSTGGIIALGIGVEQWSIEQCITKFKVFSKRAFTSRLFRKCRLSSVGIRHPTKPMEDALQEAFGTEFLFGGSHAVSNRYYNKVVVTGCTGTGDRPVVFTNYNREQDSQDLYSFVRPDSSAHELRTWEAARATSAAPSYFRPFVNKETNETFLDGAVYYNNPCRVAYHESKLIWHDVEDLHPDILLSIGTGHNLEDSPGSVEPRKRLQNAVRSLVDDEAPIETRRLQGFGSWFKNVALAQFLQIMVNRVDNILSAEHIWREFRVWVDDSHGRDSHRYMRISPKLGFRPPKLDDNEQIENLSYTVIEKLKSPKYQLTIATIAHKLIASCFYFERRGTPQEFSGYHLCKGKIRCRFPNGSNELRELGRFLQNHQRPGIQPYFTMYERHLEDMKSTVNITSDVIQWMITRAEFSLSTFDIRVLDKHGPTTIALGLQYENLQTAIMPISGFPRCVALDHPRRTESNEQPPSTPTLSKRSSRRRRRQQHWRDGTDNASALTKDTNPALHHTESSPSIQSQYTDFPRDAEDVNNWVSRRIASSKQQRSRAPTILTPYMEGSSSESSSTAVSIVGVEPSAPPVAELSADNHERVTTSTDEVDDDDEALVQALLLSQAESEERASRLTGDGVDLADLEEALRRSRIDR